MHAQKKAQNMIPLSKFCEPPKIRYFKLGEQTSTPTNKQNFKKILFNDAFHKATLQPSPSPNWMQSLKFFLVSFDEWKSIQSPFNLST